MVIVYCINVCALSLSLSHFSLSLSLSLSASLCCLYGFNLKQASQISQSCEHGTYRNFVFVSDYEGQGMMVLLQSLLGLAINSHVTYISIV